MNNQFDDTTHRPVVCDLLKTRIRELEQQVVAYKNCISRVPDKKHAK